MKKIITGSANLDMMDQVNMMVANAVDIKSCEAMIITVARWVVMQDEDSGKTVIVIKATDGTYYASISGVFIDAFMTVATAYGDMDGVSIKVIKGTSKQGRNFFSLELVK